MFRKVIMALVVLASISSVSGWAENTACTLNVNRRQHRQMKRIHQGARSGQLTKDEARRLKQDEKEIRNMKKEVKADGTVTCEERQELQQKLNEESRVIYEEKHDAETRK